MMNFDNYSDSSPYLTSFRAVRLLFLFVGGVSACSGVVVGGLFNL